MPAIGLYFPSSMTKQDVNEMRTRLNDIAAAHGYTANRGPTAGQGNLSELLIAIDQGEIALILLPDEQRAWVCDWIESEIPALKAGDGKQQAIAEALGSIVNGLDAAAKREREMANLLALDRLIDDD